MNLLLYFVSVFIGHCYFNIAADRNIIKNRTANNHIRYIRLICLIKPYPFAQLFTKSLLRLDRIESGEV